MLSRPGLVEATTGSVLLCGTLCWDWPGLARKPSTPCPWQRIQRVSHTLHKPGPAPSLLLLLLLSTPALDHLLLVGAPLAQLPPHKVLWVEPLPHSAQMETSGVASKVAYGRAGYQPEVPRPSPACTGLRSPSADCLSLPGPGPTVPEVTQTASVPEKPNTPVKPQRLAWELQEMSAPGTHFEGFVQLPRLYECV